MYVLLHVPKSNKTSIWKWFMIEISSYFSLFHFPHTWVGFLPNFFSEFHLICSSVLFLKSLNPRETSFRSFRSRLFREHQLMSNHKYQWNFVGVCLLWTLGKCQFFFCIFVTLDIVAWTWFQAIGLLNSVGNRAFERRGVRNLGPEKL